MKRSSSGKKALIVPPKKVEQQVDQKNASQRRAKSANMANNSTSFYQSGGKSSNFMNNQSGYSQSSYYESKYGRGSQYKSKLDTSFEEKKDRLHSLNKLLKGEKDTLKEELGDISDEEFEKLQKETAMNEFHRHVQKQEEKTTKVDTDKTMKKDALPTYLAAAANLQDTVTESKIEIQNEKKSSRKIAPPQRVVNGLEDVLKDNYMSKEEIEAPLPQELPPGMTESNVEPYVKHGPKRRRIHTLKERIKCCVKIQSLVRMYVQRCKYIREQKRIELLLREHQMNKDLDDYEEKVGQELYAMGKGGYQVDAKQRYKINFPGLNIPGSETLQANIFYPTLISTLAEHGALEMMNDPNKVQEANSARQERNALQDPNKDEQDDDDLLNEDQLTAKKYNLFNQRYDKIKKKRVVPMKIPLNNYFSNQGPTIIENFIKKNRNNIPLSLKKSQIEGQQVFKMPEQFHLRKNKQMNIRPHSAPSKDQEESVIYTDTFEKESIEVPSKGNQYQQKKRHSIQSSDEDYLKESFEIDNSKDQSINESIKESSRMYNNNSSVINESIKMGSGLRNQEDIHEESAIGESIQQDNSIMEESMIQQKDKKKKIHKDHSIQEEFGQSSSIEEDYENQKFDNYSEDINDKSRVGESMISEDIIGFSMDSKGKSTPNNQNNMKKKSVTFGEKKKQQESSIPILLQNNSSGILRKSQESSSVDGLHLLQPIQLHQQQLPPSKIPEESVNKGQQYNKLQFEKNEKDKSWLGKENVSDAWKKYENLKIQYENEAHLKQLSHEQMEVGKVQRDIFKLLESTKKLSDKWQQEREDVLASETNVSQKADYLYSRFQCEFNRLISNTQIGNKFSLLSNYFDYRDKRLFAAQAGKYSLSKDEFLKDPSQSKTIGGGGQVSPLLENMISNIEAKQEIMSGVLMQVVESLTNLRKTTLDFDELKKKRDDNDSKLDRLLANQEKILRIQYEKQIEQKDNEIKNLLKAFSDGQKYQANAVLSDEDVRKLRLKAMLAMNRPDSKQYTIISGSQEQVFQPQVAPQQPQVKYAELDSSIDKEALSDSSVSWQSNSNLWDTLSEKDRVKMNDFNTEQVVNFLSDLLMEEIQQDLFPMRMTTSHLSSKKPDEKSIHERANEKFGAVRGNTSKQHGTSYHQQGGIGQDSPIRKGQKTDRTLTEESKYESDFEDSMIGGNQSNLNNNTSNKSYHLEDSEASKSKLTQDKSIPNISNLSAKKKDKKSDISQDMEELKYDDDFEFEEEEVEEGSIEKDPTISSVQEEQVIEEEPDPMGMGKAFDRNSLLAEIEENDKTTDKKASSLPKLGGTTSTKPKSPKHITRPDDEDYKGDNDFYIEKVENEEGQIEKDLNKDLFKNNQTYDRSSRILNQLCSILKNKKKTPFVKQITKIIVANNSPNKTLDQFLGNTLMEQLHIFEQSELKNDDEKVLAQSFQEHFINNIIQNVHDLEQFHYDQAFNRKEIEVELIQRWEHICDVACEQTLRILEKVVPSKYYSDVKIDSFTPFKKVKRFCTINKVAKEDNDLHEIQLYELFKQQVHVQNNISDNILQIISAQLASDLISIQQKQQARLKSQK